jgi:hypothetical protein
VREEVGGGELGHGVVPLEEGEVVVLHEGGHLVLFFCGED